jgi:hypothetical protein
MTPGVVTTLSACLDLAGCDAAIDCTDDVYDTYDL